MRREYVHIDESCRASCSELSGAERRRFCDVCSKHAHDLSTMTEPETQQLIDSGQVPCVRPDEWLSALAASAGTAGFPRDGRRPDRPQWQRDRQGR